MSIILLLSILSGGYEAELREDGEWLLTCERGEIVTEVSPSFFREVEWVERSRHGVLAGDDSLFISVFMNDGSGAVLTVFRKVESGYLFIGEFTSLFGGNGIEFVVSDPFVSASSELLFRLDWTVYFRGDHSVTGGEDSYETPLKLSSFFILATDGDSLWTVVDHR